MQTIKIIHFKITLLYFKTAPNGHWCQFRLWDPYGGDWTIQQAILYHRNQPAYKLVFVEIKPVNGSDYNTARSEALPGPSTVPTWEPDPKCREGSLRDAAPSRLRAPRFTLYAALFFASATDRGCEGTLPRPPSCHRNWCELLQAGHCPCVLIWSPSRPWLPQGVAPGPQPPLRRMPPISPTIRSNIDLVSKPVMLPFASRRPRSVKSGWNSGDQLLLSDRIKRAQLGFRVSFRPSCESRYMWGKLWMASFTDTVDT